MRGMTIGYVRIDPKKFKAARLAVKPVPPRLSDVARHLDVKPQVLWNWENIYKTMPDDKLRAACKLYNAPRSQIVVSNGASA